MLATRGCRMKRLDLACNSNLIARYFLALKALRQPFLPQRP